MGVAHGTVVDFESLANDSTHGPILASDGNILSFSVEAPGLRLGRVATTGGPTEGFAPRDTPEAGSNIGNRFLTAAPAIHHYITSAL